MTDIEIWHPEQSSLAIEYTKSVLDEVRDQAIAGYRRVIRGGVEVGGVLYGTREEGKVRIVATQPIACEYKFGPSFMLSEKDKNRLLDQLTESGNIEELKGLKVVGWYVSHPRSSVSLSDADLDIFNEFFPAIWNVALVLKPGAQSVRCGFFVREARGALKIAQSYQEFDLALPRSAEGASAVRQIAEQVSSSLAAQREPAPDPGMLQRRRDNARRDLVEMPLPARPAFIPVGNGAAALAPARVPNAIAKPQVSMVTRRPNDVPRRLKWRWLVVWGCVLCAIVAGAYMYRDFTAPAPLGLRVAEKDGELVIQWEASSRPLGWANEGRIEIQGTGRSKAVIDLTPKDLAAGRYQYGGTEGDTSVRLSVTGKFGFHANESTRYVAQALSNDPNAAGTKPLEIRDRRKLQVEVRRLREELDKSQLRVKELETLLYNR